MKPKIIITFAPLNILSLFTEVRFVSQISGSIINITIKS